MVAVFFFSFFLSFCGKQIIIPVATVEGQGCRDKLTFIECVNWYHKVDKRWKLVIYTSHSNIAYFVHCYGCH